MDFHPLFFVFILHRVVDNRHNMTPSACFIHSVYTVECCFLDEVLALPQANRET